MVWDADKQIKHTKKLNNTNSVKRTNAGDIFTAKNIRFSQLQTVAAVARPD